MYRFGYAGPWVPMNQPILVLPPPPFVQINPLTLHWQVLESASLASNTPWCGEGFNDWSSPYGPVGMAPTRNLHHQYPNQYYQAPSSSGPSRNGRQHSRGFRQAGAPYTKQSKHVSPRTIADRSTGIYRGMTQIAAEDETGVEQVWRTPSKNPLMVDCRYPSSR